MDPKLSPEIRAAIEIAIKEERQRVARLGGLALAKKLSAKQRRESATKASKAAARARSLKAKQKAKNSKG